MYRRMEVLYSESGSVRTERGSAVPVWAKEVRWMK